MKNSSEYCRILYLCFLLFGMSSNADARITAAVAANMQSAMDEIIQTFKKKTDISVTPVYEASGKLVAQIKSGAPFDIFLSADMAWPESLATWGYTRGNVKTYAYGSLVVWTTGNFDLSGGLKILENPSIKTIAIADLLLTAYGPAAKKILEDAGLWSKIKDKCVYGGSISQVAHFIVTGSSDIGFAAKSTVLSKDLVNKGTWIDLDSLSHNLLPQGIVILKHGSTSNYSEAAKFYEFMFSMPARDLLVKYGYRLP
jgi:molybdate transport system substrate-binding protein